MSQYTETMALVRATGKTLLERLSHSDFNVRRKENNHQNLVTDFDLWVQEQLINGLRKIEPAANIFAEEKENAAVKGLTWFIDPIDGTTNFVSMQRNYAICVALYDNGTPVFGVVYDVAEDLCYHAVYGKEAYANERLLSKREPIAFENALFDASLTTMNNLSRRAGKSLYGLSCAARGHRAIGAASLAMCHIAEGTLDAYISHRLYPWDYAASGVILQTCGGVYDAIYDEALFTPQKAALLCCGDIEMEKWLMPYLRGEGDLNTFCCQK